MEFSRDHIVNVGSFIHVAPIDLDSFGIVVSREHEVEPLRLEGVVQASTPTEQTHSSEHLRDFLFANAKL
ncbi:hypothetical protein D3C71_2163900 [compost metagenome]